MTPASPSEPLWRQLLGVASAVEKVRAGTSLTAVLARTAPERRPGIQALSFLVLRWLGRATALRDQMLTRALPPPADALLCTALALAYRPEDGQYRDFTLVHQVVEAAKRDRATRPYAGVLNACLRRFQRERSALIRATDDLPESNWNHPGWWIDRLRTDHPQNWRSVLEAAQLVPPMTLRINPLHGDVPTYLAHLSARGLAADRTGPYAVTLHRPLPVSAVPGFDAGWVSVQDGAAQLAAPLLLQDVSAASPRILDACAAPGGKTAHLLELRPNAHVLALEVDSARAARIADTLARLRLSAEIRCADAARPDLWWDGQPFDRILLDAPCSASGVVRRHPDVRWLRRPSDIDALAVTQRNLLDRLWTTLRPGGRLLYCTCSVFRAEGEIPVKAFLQNNSDAVLLPSVGHLLPGWGESASVAEDNGNRGHDGFFYALLEKRLA